MEITQRQADLCNSLADFHRLLIVYAIAEKPCNVSKLVERLGLPQPTISRHLKILRSAGTVVAQREGKAVYYALADTRLLDALDLLRAVLTDQMKQQGNLAEFAAERPSI